MAAKYWIKLYHEILEDSKMGRLPDNLWRRAIELFLMAGELDDQGRLPCTADIAWRLRQSEEVLEADLSSLETLGILTKNEGGWLVTNFAKRQAPTETVDRVRQFRKRQRQQQTPLASSDEKVTDNKVDDYANVTKSYIDTDIDTESDKDTSPNGEGAKAPHPVRPKKLKPPKDTIPIPAAVKVYQDIARRLPDKALWLDIETKVGATPENLKQWGDVIQAYIGCGWNKLNLSGMLSFYEQGRIPSTEKVKSDAHDPLVIPPPPDPIPKPPQPEHVAIWEVAAPMVRGQMTGATFDTLFKDARPVARENGTFELRVKASALEMIEARPKVKANVLTAIQAVKPEIHDLDFKELTL